MLLGGGSYDVNFLPLGGAIETLRGVIKSFDFVILKSQCNDLDYFNFDSLIF